MKFLNDMCSFHLFNNYVLDTRYVPDTLLGAENKTGNKADVSPFFPEVTFWCRRWGY